MNTVSLLKKSYAMNCVSCDDKNVEGANNWRSPDDDGIFPEPPQDFYGHTWHQTDVVMFGITKTGLVKFGGLENNKSNMPIYDGILTDDEIIAALSVIKSRWPIETQKCHDEMNYRKARTKGN